MFLSSTLGRRFPQRVKIAFAFTLALAAAIAIGAIAAHQIILATAGLLILILSLAIIIWPESLTLLVVFLLYTNAAVIAVKYHGVPFVLGASVPLFLVFPLIYILIFRRQKVLINSIIPLLLVFLSVQAFGTLISENIDVSLNALITYTTEGLILYFLVLNVVRSPTALRRVIWTLLIAGTLIGSLSVFQQVTRTFNNYYWGFAQVGDTGFGTGIETIQGQILQPRLAGPLGEKNYYAQVMLMLVPLGLFRFWGERSRLLRLLAAAATTIIMLGAALTFSRGGAVALILLVIIMVMMRYIKIYQFAIIAISLLLLMTAVPQFGKRLTSLQALTALLNEDSGGVASTDTSVQGRLGEMLSAGLVFLDHPVVGVGPGMFKYYYLEYADQVGLQLHTTTREAHNLFLDIGADNGALGLGCFLGILFFSLRGLAQTRKTWAAKQPELANMAAGFMLSIISYLLTGLFLSMAYSRYFWLILALGGAASYIAGSDAFAKPENIERTSAALHA
jgi:putative inorganic carbon (HCO3(-)) transporter